MTASGPRAAGDFNVRMTPQGDLTVFGVYTIEEGHTT
jgi:hypothetical protein